jgi:hypothetical protein
MDSSLAHGTKPHGRRAVPLTLIDEYEIHQNDYFPKLLLFSVGELPRWLFEYLHLSEKSRSARPS